MAHLVGKAEAKAHQVAHKVEGPHHHTAGGGPLGTTGPHVGGGGTHIPGTHHHVGGTGGGHVPGTAGVGTGGGHVPGTTGHVGGTGGGHVPGTTGHVGGPIDKAKQTVKGAIHKVTGK